MSQRFRSFALIIAAATLWPVANVATAATHAIRRYVIVHDDSMSGTWIEGDSTSAEEVRQQFGHRFAWFRKDGHEYVIKDSAVMDELDRAMEPQKKVNRMQAGVNREQDRVNRMQSRVNDHQHDVNELQARV